MISGRRVGSRHTLDNAPSQRQRDLRASPAGNEAQYAPGATIDSVAQASVTGGRDGLKRFDQHQGSHFASGLG